MEDSGDCFSIKWSNFRSNLTEGFHDFLREEAMVDVTLAAEGKFVQAHKLVLSVCSPYFKSLFKVNPCKHPIVILKDVGHNDLSYLLEFMYKGEVGVKHEDLPSFLKLADTLKVKGLAGEKIQKNENSKNIDQNSAKVRRKINRDSVSDVNKENSEFHSQSGKKILRSKKRRLSCKSESVKKLKSDKCVDSVNKCKDDNISEDEDNNPLIKFIEGDNVKSGEGSKESESRCDNENESQCDNKTSFSVWSDGVPESDDSGGQDINHDFFQSGCSEETEQTPQESMKKRAKNVRTSLIWTYFIKYPESATCRLCGRNFKGFRPHTSIECHLKTRHHKQWLDFMRNREEQRKQLVRDQFGHLFSKFYGHYRSVLNYKPSPIWKFFEKRDRRSICLICCATLSGVYTTNAEKHLRTKHPKPHKEFVLMKMNWIKNGRV